MNAVIVSFQRCAADVVLPDYATAGAAGMDIAAYIGAPVTLAPFERAAINTGFAMQLPDGYEAQIRPRSGLALKYGVTVANAPGTIDSDYRGDLGVILWNGGADAFRVTHGMRIAQMVVAPVVQATFAIVDALDETERGVGGFGSTGAS